MTSRALLLFLAIISMFILLTPFYLTTDLPDRKDVRETHVELSSLDTVIEKGELTIAQVADGESMPEGMR